jgi:ATP-dependent DNA helicase RecQ
MDDLDQRAHGLLRLLTGQPEPGWHPGQLEAIRALVVERRRVLVVQRTGWGKSAVYFIATRLLRDAGSGPTILVSPLLALMRNQIHAAARMGIRAATINSANTTEWDEVVDRVLADEVDVLLISPERLANKGFQERVMGRVGATAGLVVVDEAHCISDWGHDFRPDYRRVKRVLDLLPPTVPVLGCTATANSRVVDDVVSQLGSDIDVFRGALGRDGLSLHVITLPSQAARLAWLAATIPILPGSGIVYCLTVRDVALLTDWLRLQGIAAECYTGQSASREEVEQALLDNRIRVVVATSALGMGFDKPDLAYVIHFQAPGSVISYYQQVGRAGRQLSRSLGVLLRGMEDASIQDWFITSAFPTADECRQVLSVLEGRDGFVKLSEIEAAANVRPSRVEMLMKNLEVDGIIVADGKKYRRTPHPFVYDADRIDAIMAVRRQEQAAMLQYGTLTSGCRMMFLRAALDDPDPSPCGICDLCAGPSLAGDVDQDVVLEAARFVRGQPLDVDPRKRWPDNTTIPPDWRVEPGRALCRWGDGGWSELVRRGQEVDGRYDARLVDALADLVQQWSPGPPGASWVTWIPSMSLEHPELVSDLAKGLADRLGLRAVDALARTRSTQPQTSMHNSAQQLANVHGAFTVPAGLPSGPVLLVDDLINSKWTMTYVGSLLRQAGCPAVIPVALAYRGSS